MAAIGADVAERVAAAEPVKWETLPLADARKQGAMMLFGEKYPDPVRMVSMGEFSKELCGGTHLTNTREVEQFEILSEEGVSAGTRRIIALTGAKAAEHVKQMETALDEAAKVLGVTAIGSCRGGGGAGGSARELRKQLTGGGGGGAKPQAAAQRSAGGSRPAYEVVKRTLLEAGRLLSVAPLDVPQRIAALQADVAALEKQLAERSAAGPLSGERLLESAEKVGGVTVVVTEVPGVEANLMRQLIDQVRVEGSIRGGAAGKPARGRQSDARGRDLARTCNRASLSAGEWIRPVAAAVGGGGGGRPDMAQAGGKDPAKLPEALQIAKDTIRKMIAG